jgi:hypothetical protein
MLFDACPAQRLPEPLLLLPPRSLEPPDLEEPDAEREPDERSLPPALLPDPPRPPLPVCWFLPLGLLLGMSFLLGDESGARDCAKGRFLARVWKTRKKRLFFAAACDWIA